MSDVNIYRPEDFDRDVWANTFNEINAANVTNAEVIDYPSNWEVIPGIITGNRGDKRPEIVARVRASIDCLDDRSDDYYVTQFGDAIAHPTQVPGGTGGELLSVHAAVEKHGVEITRGKGHRLIGAGVLFRRGSAMDLWNNSKDPDTVFQEGCAVVDLNPKGLKRPVYIAADVVSMGKRAVLMVNPHHNPFLEEQNNVGGIEMGDNSIVVAQKIQGTVVVESDVVFGITRRPDGQIDWSSAASRRGRRGVRSCIGYGAHIGSNIYTDPRQNRPIAVQGPYKEDRYQVSPESNSSLRRAEAIALVGDALSTAEDISYWVLEKVLSPISTD